VVISPKQGKTGLKDDRVLNVRGNSMNTKTAYFGLIMVLTILSTIRICNASTGPDLYQDSLYIEKSSAEVPKAFESSAREGALAANSDTAPTAAESVSDVQETVAVTKKSKSHKKVAKKAAAATDDSSSAE
jgi:hypothetical protein